MNEFTLAGLFLLGISVVAITSLFAFFKIEDYYPNLPALPSYMAWGILSIAAIFFILGEVPYTITIWLLLYGSLMGVYLRLTFKE